MNDLISQPLAPDRSPASSSLSRPYRGALRIAAHPLSLLLLAFFSNALLWALIVAPAHAPDEADHFDYVSYLALTHQLPTYGQTPRIATPNSLNSETQQPPLYYLLAVPFHALLGGRTETQQYLAIRLLSVTLGTLAVALTYALGRLLVPQRREFALALAALVGFNPMYTFMSAAVSNDALINLVYPALLLVLCMLLRLETVTRTRLIGLGALLGVGLLSKFSIAGGMLASGVVLAALALRQPEQRFRTLVNYAAWTSCGLLLIAGWYIARNWRLYGDPTGVLVMGAYSVNPMQPYRTVGTFWQMIATRRPGMLDFWPALFHGFWGVFDYYTFWMPPRVYLLLDLLLAIGIGAAAISGARAWRRGDPAIRRRWALAAACAVIALVTLALTLNYCYQIDYQPQGRYLLPALAPLALAMLVGWEQLFKLFRLRYLAAPLLTLFMLSVNVLALLTTLAPGYHDGYLSSLTTSTQTTVQPVSGAFEARSSFVAEHSRIERLEVLLSRPPNATGALIWRLRQDGATTDLTVAVDQKPLKGLGRYVIAISQPVIAGQRYTLIVQAPWTTEDKRASAYLAPGPGAAGELSLQVIYPMQHAGATLRRIDYLLRSSEPGWPRGNGQRLLSICMLSLTLIVAACAFHPLRRDAWAWIAGIGSLGLVLIVLWAPPGKLGPAIPTHTLSAQPTPLLALDDAPGSVADLILLSGSTLAHKDPPDDHARRISQVQPYQFTIGGDKRAVLAMQPPSAITYTLPLPAHAWLQTALALDPQVWQADKGDGVEFVVTISAADGRHELLRRYIDPKSRPADRRWHEIAIDLSAYAGQEVGLTLLTLPGPAEDGRYDWSGWAAPAITQSNSRP
jgi:uncharacterized membrane protein